MKIVKTRYCAHFGILYFIDTHMLMHMGNWEELGDIIYKEDYLRNDIALMGGGEHGEGIGGEYSQSIWNSWMGTHYVLITVYK